MYFEIVLVGCRCSGAVGVAAGIAAASPRTCGNPTRGSVQRRS